MNSTGAWWIEQINGVLKDIARTEEVIKVFQDWAKAQTNYLQTFPGQMAWGLTPEERIEVAQYLYWNVPQILANPIAHDLLKLEKMCELQAIIGSIKSAITCERCGEPIGVTSRNDLDALNRRQRRARPQYAEDYNILCQSCHEAIMNERETEYEQQRTAIASQAGSRLEELKTMPYREYLQTPEWQERRKSHLKSAKYRCQLCNSPDSLDVHHRTYEHRGEERYQDLIALCRPCHELFHKQGKLNGQD